MKKNLKLLLAALTAASMLTGCGSSKGMMNAADTAAYESAAATEAAPAEMAEDYLYDAGYGYDGVEEVAEAAEEAPADESGAAIEEKAEEVNNPQTGRKLITTMNISAETENFDALMGNLERQITELGGYIESSDQWNGSVDYYGNRINDRNASLTIRIPMEKLDGFLMMMEENCNITNKSRSVEDVTLAYVDLESHKKALLTAEERLLELLEKAETVEDLISIEEKLTDVRYQLESMESQLRTYDNRINYSTLYLNIQEVTRLTPVEEPTTWSRIKNGFSENLYHLGEDIKDFFIGVVINIPYIVLWIILLGIAAFIGFLVVKHDKKKRMKRLAQQQTTENMSSSETEKNEGRLPYGVKKEKASFGGLWKKGGKKSASGEGQAEAESLQAGSEAEPAKEKNSQEKQKTGQTKE